jgi:hypothetical protein
MSVRVVVSATAFAMTASTLPPSDRAGPHSPTIKATTENPTIDHSAFIR